MNITQSKNTTDYEAKFKRSGSVMRVRLIKDLTDYDPNLVYGIEGYADTNNITYTDWEAEQVWCKFPNTDGIYIGWNALEILSKKFWGDRERDIQQSVKIDYVVGPRGGFKWVRVYSVDGRNHKRIYTTDVKNIGERLIKMAEEQGKSYDKQIYRKNY